MEKRSQQDRRNWKGRTDFPLRDSNDELVRADRRTSPERRLSGIEAEWLEMADEAGRA